MPRGAGKCVKTSRKDTGWQVLQKSINEKEKISECRQGGMSVVEFYSKLRGFWSELDNHVKAPHCSCNGCNCGGCKCNIRPRTIAMFEAEKSYQFPLGLNDDLYSQVRGQILGMEPSPSLEKIFNIVIQEGQDKKLMVGHNDRVEIVGAFTVTKRAKQPTYKHCGKYGHDEAGCFELIGYLNC